MAFTKLLVRKPEGCQDIYYPKIDSIMSGYYYYSK